MERLPCLQHSEESRRDNFFPLPPLLTHAVPKTAGRPISERSQGTTECAYANQVELGPMKVDSSDLVGEGRTEQKLLKVPVRCAQVSTSVENCLCPGDDTVRLPAPVSYVGEGSLSRVSFSFFR